jgi:hypothetical protein
MKTRNVVIAIIVVAIVAILALAATALLFQPHNITATSSSTSTYEATPTFDVPLVASSTNNACFVNGYNDSIVVDNGVYYSCSASLRGNQSIKQNIFRSFLLYGNYSLSVNASKTVTVSIAQEGVVVYSGSGGSISYIGQIGQNEPMYVMVKNSETTYTNYTLGIDFTKVSI